MHTDEIIKSWRWRIAKAGHKMGSFCVLINIAPSALSEYQSFKKSPSLKRFNLIEQTLKDMGV
jgi:hypothetical protein